MLLKRPCFSFLCFHKNPCFFCKNFVCPPLPPLNLSPRRAKSILSPRAIFGGVIFFEAFFLPSGKKSAPMCEDRRRTHSTAKLTGENMSFLELIFSTLKNHCPTRYCHLKLKLNGKAEIPCATKYKRSKCYNHTLAKGGKGGDAPL